jgi:hypothetical protein
LHYKEKINNTEGFHIVKPNLWLLHNKLTTPTETDEKGSRRDPKDRRDLPSHDGHVYHDQHESPRDHPS